MSKRSSSTPPDDDGSAPADPNRRWKRIAGWGAVVVGSGALVVLVAAIVAVVAIYPKLPDVSALSDYRPKLPLRVYSAEGQMIGEFGEERRNLTPFANIPKVMKDAVLAVEDARFYDHGGVDYKGFLRAAVASLKGGRKQGASTITMQVARNVYLSSERTMSRKTYEILLALRLEQQLTKDQILEIYLNQIYLGNRAYGFAAAAETYFGKPLQDVTIAEAAMLAGLPKAPGANNPVANPRRARARQLYVIDRMQETGFITAEQAAAAKKEELHLRDAADPNRLHAEYVAETVRQMMYAQYGDSIYTSGLKVYTSLVAADQAAAYKSLRKGIMDYERRQAYRGPEKFVDLPTEQKEVDEAVDDALAEHPDNGDVIAAVVLDANPKEISAVRANGETIQITGDGLKPAQSGLAAKAPPNIKIRRGAVIRVAKTPKNTWEITQLPEVEAAFIGMDPRSGAIKALVGGFDFGKNKFNHVTQAWRQPGSSFKPFIYSAALEKGFTPATVVNDAPLYFDPSANGGQPWEPKNFEGTYEGPMPLRTALMKSKNLVTLRVLQSIGAPYAQDWVTKFGFDKDKQPANLPMGLGAGSVTPMQMAVGYSVFANGGYRVNPYLVTKVTDMKGKVLMETEPPVLDESRRAIPQRNAFIMSSLLQSVVRNGTGFKAYQALKRDDLYGKTGTTNDSFDTWFAGFQPTMVGVAWVGYDTPRQLGVRGETGGSLSLPIWTGYMQTALQGVPMTQPAEPPGVVRIDGELYFDDFTPGHNVASLGLDSTEAPQPVEELTSAPIGAPPPPEERNKILDFFR
ncbi:MULTISPECIES: penicillin-binding protein 1A [Variovorax]|jgi:penicillin-binding protein 1A|uniref:penicillin-binding protein 1A n=1 Tax=Variovorax TaxID=34072 RepID=UPI0008690121|nr:MULTISPECIES: penicillin-binding protein 1A [Variovorax]MBN8755268.1 penicillin-binding protein 1A [Variovorax sp.]ODU15980.1 MAG: penicillin-binding protein [Variovorax sp. SCN 67-85]ODV21261.1 MAG: penicillin-binding protein [Variovorax sp. SCN 67-20]OJZ14178.1 MAG: penicillin-binding protein [Variovorax sp. 67-131]UKI08422.1 penicillin-binding protein 1A [Variovorax paradoxus]